MCIPSLQSTEVLYSVYKIVSISCVLKYYNLMMYILYFCTVMITPEFLFLHSAHVRSIHIFSSAC